MFQKLDAHAGAGVGPGDQTGNIGDNETLILPIRNDAKIGNKGSERVIGDLRPGRRNPGYECRFADVGTADNSYICQELEFEEYPALLAGHAILGKTGGAICGRSEVGVTLAPDASLGSNKTFTVMGKIRQYFHGLGFFEDGADGNGDFDVFPAVARSVVPLAARTAGGGVAWAVPEVEESGEIVRGMEDDIPSFAPITAVWPASGDKLFPPKAHTTATAMASLDEYFCFVYKFHKFQKNKGAYIKRLLSMMVFFAIPAMGCCVLFRADVNVYAA